MGTFGGTFGVQLNKTINESRNNGVGTFGVKNLCKALIVNGLRGAHVIYTIYKGGTGGFYVHASRVWGGVEKYAI